jgi:hypothetical protein
MLRYVASQAHGAWISFPPTPFTLLSPLGKKCKQHEDFPTEVNDMARNMKMELFTFSLILYQSKNYRLLFLMIVCTAFHNIIFWDWFF